MVTKRFHYPKTLPKEDVAAFRVFVPKALRSTFLFVLSQQISHSKGVEVMVLCVLPNLFNPHEILQVIVNESTQK